MTPRANEHRAADELRKAYARILEEEANYDSLHKNVPLNHASKVEREFRLWMLDHEEVASEAHGFFTEYAKRNPQILTPVSKGLITLLNSRPGKIYITELNVPSVKDGPYKWITDIDLVSFYDIPNTMNILNGVLSGICGIQPFSEPRQKGSPEHRYWQTHSLTHIYTPENHRITDIKLRKRIHGSGYSITDGAIASLQREGSDHLLGSFKR